MFAGLYLNFQLPPAYRTRWWMLGCGIAWSALAGAGFAVLMAGLFAMGAGIALPYSSAPRIGARKMPAIPLESGAKADMIGGSSRAREQNLRACEHDGHFEPWLGPLTHMTAAIPEGM